jgi:hypothetical protein
MRLPNFLVIGAQKSGTTWLHRHLQKRPDVFVPMERKELMFFDDRARYERLGIEGYARFFEGARSEPAVGEVTPGYMWVSGEKTEVGAASEFRTRVPLRVRDALGPEVRLVALLRNPIERAISGFLHHRAKKRIPADARLVDHLEFGGIGHLGFYGAHLDRWGEFFPRSNFLLVTYGAFFEHERPLRRILRFIGAKTRGVRPKLGEKIYRGVGFRRDSTGAYDRSGRMLASAAELDGLRRIYEPDVERLRQRWDVDTSHWIEDFPMSSGVTVGGRLKARLTRWL